jgi:hypothetical protein
MRSCRSAAATMNVARIHRHGRRSGRQDPQATERAILAMALAHIKDRATGRFCRHANWKVARLARSRKTEVQNAKPFLEAGASLIDSLCWLAKQTGDDRGQLTQMALRAAQVQLRNEMRNRAVAKSAGRQAMGLLCIDDRSRSVGGQPDSGNRLHTERKISNRSQKPRCVRGSDSDSTRTQSKYYGRLAVESGCASAARTATRLDTADVRRGLRYPRASHAQLPDANGRGVS